MASRIVPHTRAARKPLQPLLRWLSEAILNWMRETLSNGSQTGFALQAENA
jgi:hypothetical protein